MTNFHAVMRSETGEEFGASVEASDRDTAYARLRENYPESSCVQLESPADTAERERRIYQSVMREMDGDDYDDFDEDDDY
jgi:hypothetical protein